MYLINKMKIKILFVVIVIMSTFSITATAQTKGIATTNDAYAKLIVPMSVKQNKIFNFGTITLTDKSGGTVTIASVLVDRSFSGGVAASAVGDPALNGGYDVTGTINSTYTLTLPETITVTETIGKSATMSIGTLKARFKGANSDALSSTLSGTGTDDFTVGGILTIGNNQIGGIYKGTYTLSVDYN